MGLAADLEDTVPSTEGSLRKFASFYGLAPLQQNHGTATAKGHFTLEDNDVFIT